MTALPNLADTVQSAEAKVLALMLQGVVEDIGELKVSIRSMSETMIKLTSLEVENKSMREAVHRVFEAIQKLEDRFISANKESVDERKQLDNRVHVLERDMGPLKEVRKWIIGGVLACVGIVFGTTMVRPPPAVNITLPPEIVSKVPK